LARSRNWSRRCHRSQRGDEQGAVIAASAHANSAAAIIEERNDVPEAEALADLDGHLRCRTTPLGLFARNSITPPQIRRGYELRGVRRFLNQFRDQLLNARQRAADTSGSKLDSRQSRRDDLTEFGPAGRDVVAEQFTLADDTLGGHFNSPPNDGPWTLAVAWWGTYARFSGSRQIDGESKSYPHMREPVAAHHSEKNFAR
jgi:hypothetical protein